MLDGLLLDPTLLVVVGAAPPEMRSIAGAVLMWNEGWLLATLSPEAPLWSVRVNVEATLTTVSEGCLDKEIVGRKSASATRNQQSRHIIRHAWFRTLDLAADDQPAARVSRSSQWV